MLNTGKLAGKTVLITGASRGIGKAIALKAAKDGAKIVVAAKTSEPHPKLPGTIFTAAQEIEAAGGQALPCVVDIRNEDQVQACIEEAVRKFGGIDILVNNASAISLTGTQETPMKKYDLMHQINTRGTYLVTKLALPYLRQSSNGHVLNISPPLNMKPRWFRDHVAYTMAKYGMSMCVLGMAEEFKGANIAFNALWPKTAIITAAMEMLGGGGDIAKQCRYPDIMADAAYIILTRSSRNFTGNFVVDEDILKEEGVSNFDQYACVPGAKLLPDFFLDEFDDFVDAPTLSVKSSGPKGGKVDAVFDRIRKHLSQELVGQTQAIYQFNVSGNESGSWYVDLKNGSGSCGTGNPASKPDVTFSLNDDVFHQMFQGTLKPTMAFMSGKMKLEGNMGKAMVLEKLMGKMQTRGFHSLADRTHFGHVKCYDVPSLFSNANIYTTSTNNSDYSDVPQVFDRIKSVASSKIVEQVKAIYLFDVDQRGKYFIDFKNGEGEVGQGDPQHKPDVTISMNEEVFLKIFNRELAPATAFMTGKIKISGDLTKALTLEKVMVAAREARDKTK